jgi:hypothetical protein|tara:strand:- start:433 stop:660 length:228 start_codon:yes stop_codon:yes gene_type:complete
MKKIFLYTILLGLTGCLNSTAMLGPFMTLGTSGGNLYQAGASYGTNMTVKKITGKTPTEHLSTIMGKKKENNKQN